MTHVSIYRLLSLSVSFKHAGLQILTYPPRELGGHIAHTELIHNAVHRSKHTAKDGKNAHHCRITIFSKQDFMTLADNGKGPNLHCRGTTTTTSVLMQPHGLHIHILVYKFTFSSPKQHADKIASLFSEG